MNERGLRSLVDKVKAGRLSRRGFIRRLAAAGLTAPMATQLLALSGVAMAQSRPVYKPTKRGGGGLLKVIATDPSTRRDIPKFCLFLGHELLEQQVEAGTYLYWIKKKID